MARTKNGLNVFAVLTALVMLIQFFPVLKTDATSTEMEEVISWAINTANDQSHGYSQANRNGPDYDCSSFVYYALKSAGLCSNLTYAFNTEGMRSQLPKCDFTYISWSDLGGSSNLQRGDILWYRYGTHGHTEIYIGDNKLVGAHGQNATSAHPNRSPATGDQGDEVSVISFYNSSSNPWMGIFRRDGVPPPPPPPVQGKYFPKCGSEYSSLVEALNSIGVDSSKANRKRIAEANGISDYTYSAEQNIYMLNLLKDGILINPDGEPNPPILGNISTDKTSYKVGETINFSFSYSNASEAYVLIDANGVRVEPWANVTGKTTYSCSFNEPGYYAYRLYAVNDYGTPATEWRSFTVYDKPPTNSNLTADKTMIAVGEEITFTASSDLATGYTIGIDNEKERYLTQEMENGSLTLTFDKSGNYGAYVTSYNSVGYVDSSWINFTVYSKMPTYGKLESESEKYTFVVGDAIQLVASSDLATEYWLGFDKGSERIITENMPNGRYSVTFTEPGDYSAYVTVSNKYGGIDSERIYFSVYDKAPTFGTLEIIDEKTTYFVGDTIQFKATSDYASEYWIGIDKDKKRIITNSMKDAVYELTLTEAGEYSAYVSVSNGIGGLDSKSVFFKVYDKLELQGDINLDGRLTVADVILLQKWLLAESDTILPNWKAADLCENDRLDILDLCLLKQKLIS